MTLPARDLFDGDPGYLNTASLGLPPRSATAALLAAVEDWRRGRSEPADFDDAVTRSRRAWAALSGVEPSWVAVGSTVSALVGLVAAALPDGAQVLTAAGDFTSVVFPFLAQHGRGVGVREVPLERLAGSVDRATTLVAVSAVQSADGRLVDLDALSTAAAEVGAQVLLDTTQSCGWLPVDCSRVDYAVCAAYKWLLCPRGVAFLSVRPDRLGALVPHSAGWYAGADIWSSIYGGPLRLAADARRLDVSPAWLSWAGAAPALELLAGLDMPAVRANNTALADALLAGLGRPAQGSAIVTLDGGPRAAAALAAADVRTAVRAGRVRASFHLYNDRVDVARAVAALTG